MFFRSKLQSWSAGDDSGFVEEIHDLAGESLELVVEVVREKIDALVRALDPRADLGQVLGLLVAQLVQFRPELAQQLFEFLFQGGTALEVIDDLEKDEKDRGHGSRIDQPGGELHRIGLRDFLGENGHQAESKEIAEIEHE